MRTAIPVHASIAQSVRPHLALSSLAQFLVFGFLATGSLHAAELQTNPKSLPTQSATHKPVRAHKHTLKAVAPAPVPQAAPQAAPAPKPPDWPANAQPTDAAVVWNSQGLSIHAFNSSLSQILKDVATATGAQVEGLGADQRIFGTYGPGRARDVLAQLLDGSGYNVLMVGDRGQGTPREVVLSAQPHGPPSPAVNTQADSSDAGNDADDQPPEPPEQPQPPSVRNGFAPGAPPRTPQQIMQEMQERQQRQLQQQPSNPQ
jgi:hypothetical protein